MRIGVVSDSHGNHDALSMAIEQMGDVQAIFHLGDYTGDGEMIGQWKGHLPIYTLRGNMDHAHFGGEDFVNTVFEGKRIIACHGHAFGVKRDLNTYFYKAKSLKADIALYGHTHCAFCEREEGILLMNPGALSYSPFGMKSFGIITIEDGKVEGEIYPLIESAGLNQFSVPLRSNDWC